MTLHWKGKILMMRNSNTEQSLPRRNPSYMHREASEAGAEEMEPSRGACLFMGPQAGRWGPSPSAWTPEASQRAMGRRHPSPSSLPGRGPRPPGRWMGPEQRARAWKTGLAPPHGRGTGDGILPLSTRADFRTPVVPFCCICIVMIGDCRGLGANF